MYMFTCVKIFIMITVKFYLCSFISGELHCL